ncbi:MAG: M20/M25/M40 family metallo-hydrolase [Winogradskyella sp.]|nr:M20/M25/M40 family metallo-hydrolase [Winogradskyella sp.]
MHPKNLLLIIVLFVFTNVIQASTDKNLVSVIYFEKKPYSIQEILSKYIQIQSLSGSESEAGKFIKTLCAENGLYITQMGDTDGNYNFSASVLPLDKTTPNIIFLNHLDVVPVGDVSQWDFPPFSGEITDFEILGRGAWDNKGAAIMQLFTVIEIANRYKNKPLKYNVSLLSVSCEETACEGGIKYVIDNFLETLNPAVVIGEGPPALKGIIKNKPDLSLFGISVAQKRALWLRLKLELKTNGHSSVTPLTYANKEMVIALNNLFEKQPKLIFNDLNTDLLKEFGRLNKGFNGLFLKHPKLFKPLIASKLREDPLLLALFSNTITLTSLSDLNDKVNAIPNLVTAVLDCRLLPGESTDKFLKKLQRSLDNKNITIEIINEMKDSPISSNTTNFYKHLESAILTNYKLSKTASVLLPNSNDISLFRQHGILGYSSIPVQIDRKYLDCIHNHNERIPLEILDHGRDTYVNFIELCLNETK